MKVFYRLLPLLALALTSASCSLLGPERDCNEVIRLPDSVVSALPYQQGQRLTFDVSDGSQLTAVINIERHLQNFDGACEDELTVRFDGVNVNASLNFNLSPFLGNGTDEIWNSYNVNGHPETFGLRVDSDGRVVPRNNTQRMIGDTVLNGRMFREVLRIDYDQSAVLRCYYSHTVGFIGVEMADGSSIFLRE